MHFARPLLCSCNTTQFFSFNFPCKKSPHWLVWRARQSLLGSMIENFYCVKEHQRELSWWPDQWKEHLEFRPWRPSHLRLHISPDHEHVKGQCLDKLVSHAFLQDPFRRQEYQFVRPWCCNLFFHNKEIGWQNILGIPKKNALKWATLWNLNYL